MTNEDELKASAFQGLLTFRERKTRETPLRWEKEWIQEQCVPGSSVNMPPGNP